MKKLHLLFFETVMAAVILMIPVAGQDTGDTQNISPADSTFSQPDSIYLRSNLPRVNLTTDNFFLQRAFYPDLYKSEFDVKNDLRKISGGDSALMARWDSLGMRILGIIENLSGVKWVERGCDIHLLRYLPVEFMYDPLALPMEGIRRQSFIEAAPGGLYRFFNLIRILAGRNLMQLGQGQYAGSGVRRHPLLEQSQYRFDVMTLILAVAVAEQVIPPDSLGLILSSETFKARNPGLEIYRNHFRSSWKLSAQTPLLYYITRESAYSPLVELTKAPRVRQVKPRAQGDREQTRLSAGGGRLGFSVARTSRGYLEVIDIDTLGLAYANGLMVGDQIKRVNGEYPRNARELMAKILNKIDTDGVYMLVARGSGEIGVLMVPVQDMPKEGLAPRETTPRSRTFPNN